MPDPAADRDSRGTANLEAWRMDDRVAIRITKRFRDEVMFDAGDALVMDGERGRRFLRRWSRKVEEIKRKPEELVEKRRRPAVSVAMADAEIES
jgi:hypothetical protein